MSFRIKYCSSIRKSIKTDMHLRLNGLTYTFTISTVTQKNMFNRYTRIRQNNGYLQHVFVIILSNIWDENYSGRYTQCNGEHSESHRPAGVMELRHISQPHYHTGDAEYNLNVQK
jgi:hypothetical protein